MVIKEISQEKHKPLKNIQRNCICKDTIHKNLNFAACFWQSPRFDRGASDKRYRDFERNFGKTV